MDPLSVSAGIVALVQLTSTVVHYLSEVKDGPKELQKLRLEIPSLLNILFRLQDQANQAEQDDSFLPNLGLLNGTDGPFEQLRTVLEKLAAKVAPTEGLGKLRKTLKWPFDKKEIHEILNTIERQKTLFNLALQNDHVTLSKAIRDDVRTIDKRIIVITEGISDLQTGTMSNDIRKWLSAPDPSSNYNKALGDHHEHTGKWFLTRDDYIRWLSKPGSLLSLYGIPGCGKTVLSSIIIRNTIEYCRWRSDSAVLYFYFDFSIGEKRKHGNMIRSLIQQLYSQYASTSHAVESIYSSCANGDRQPTCDALLTCLRGMMGDLDETYIIIDALDECVEIQEVITDLEELTAHKDANLHILTTSRREKDIEGSLDLLDLEVEKVFVQGTRVNSDIRVYIQNRLTVDRALRRWQKRPDIQQEIEDSLMGKANGMYVTLLLETIDAH